MTAPSTFKTNPTWLKIVIGLLALMFVVTGVSKLASVPPSPQNFARWGYSTGFMYTIGAIEVVCGLALLWPRSAPFAAVVLIGTMFGAIKTGIQFGELMHVFLPAVLIAMLASVIYTHRERFLRGSSSGSR